MRLLPRSWFAGDAVHLAPRLLGKIVRRGDCAGIIVETEAYTIDPASHAFRITPRSQVMRDTYGHWYVYFTYGMHWCSNITTNKSGAGAILIRAVEPLEGIAYMKRRRNTPLEKNLCSGPAKFCQAFGITGKDNGRSVDERFGIFKIEKSDTTIYRSVLTSNQIGTSPRIGVSSGADLLWRFFIKDNPFVSR